MRLSLLLYWMATSPSISCIHPVAPMNLPKTALRKWLVCFYLVFWRYNRRETLSLAVSAMAA